MEKTNFVFKSMLSGYLSICPVTIIRSEDGSAMVIVEDNPTELNVAGFVANFDLFANQAHWSLLRETDPDRIEWIKRDPETNLYQKIDLKWDGERYGIAHVRPEALPLGRFRTDAATELLTQRSNV